MANTKQTMIDAMVAALDGLSDVATATRDLPTPANQQAAAPFITRHSSLAKFKDYVRTRPIGQ